MSKMYPGPRGLIAAFADGGGSAEAIAAIAKFREGFEAFKAKQDEAAAAINATLNATGADVAAAIKVADAAREAAEAAAANMVELEQRLADRIELGDTPGAQSMGEVFTAAPEYKALIEKIGAGTTPGAGFNLRVEANTLSGQSGSPLENEDTLVPTQRRGSIVPGAFRTLRVRDVIPTIPTTSNAYQFVRELAFTNAAAETAEGAAKAESTLTFQDSTANIRTIAHFIKASNQILADAPALRAYIDNRLQYGVELREETQIITGDGTGQNISGMTTSGNYTAFTPSTGDNAIDSVNRAKYAILGADYMPTAIIMNPADWGALERLKDGVNGGYLVGNPFGSITPVLWGLPVIVSNSMTSGSFIIADFATSYEYAERQTTVVEVGYVNDDFTKNLVTIRAEKRGTLATIRPASVRFGSLTV